MSRNSTSLLVRPLYYDALSGEFNPPSDISRRSHTLGRLAIATFTKGELISEPGAEVVMFRYIPSWAPAVKTIVACEIDTNSANHTLDLLQLETESSQLSLVDCSDNSGQGSGITTIHDNESYTLLPNSLGDELSSTRSRITDMAQEFFNLAVQL